MTQQLQAIRGMRDIFPPESHAWKQLIAVLEQTATSFGYSPSAMPIVEQTEVFLRSVGASSDIVTKEMYRFVDKGNNDVCLRPEATAGVVRALLQHNLLQPHSMHRLYYTGPMFRYERPQKGRQRQFHQFGVECFGVADHNAELELLALAHHLWRTLGVADTVHLHINSLGNKEDRETYKAQLLAYLDRHVASLDADSQQRLDTNPLRIFDSKNQQTQEIMRAAPVITDSLSAPSRAHLEGIMTGLEAMDIAYTLDNQLVRGLDYYDDCVFEYKTTALGAQDTVCGGGRYNRLTEQFGAAAFPAAGFAIGLERLLLLAHDALSDLSPVDAYIVCIDTTALTIAHAMRQHLLAAQPHWQIVIDYSQTSLRSQMQKANKKAARVALILGEDECRLGEVTVKDMSGETEQQRIQRDQLLACLATLISKH